MSGRREDKDGAEQWWKSSVMDTCTQIIYLEISDNFPQLY